MPHEGNYWTNKLVSRRRAVQGAAVAGAALGALSLVGCGSDSGKSSAGTSTGAKSSAATDFTQGKPGGSFYFQAASFPPSYDPIGSRLSAGAKAAGLVYSQLLAYKHGRPGVDPSSIDVEPDALAAMPEQPDQLTYVMKLQQGIKFHNGRTVTAEDVKYSLDSYAFGDKSAYKDTYTHVDKVETPDPNTIILKTKIPYADTVQSLAAYVDPFIVAKEHQEGPDVSKRMMGSGPYIFVDSTAPISESFRKNPDYHRKPFPYFDEIKFFTSTDDSKKVADFSSKQIHVTWWNPIEPADQIRSARPDAQVWAHPASGYGLYFRSDIAPFKDKRVRQALSMSIDRKQIRSAVSKGQGEDDQVFSIINKPWGFRKPSELKSAKNWVFDPTAAKQLLSAAGVQTPLESTWVHWDASVNGQATVDMAVLSQAKWRELGIANVRDISLTGAQYTQMVSSQGRFEGIAHGPNQQNIVLGKYVRDQYWSPPEGARPAPTNNVAYAANPQMSSLLDKQLTQFNFEERKTTFHEIEELMGEDQWKVILSTYTQTWFADPSVKGIQIPIVFYGGSGKYMSWWWFDKA